jgi:hypothetical protein
MNSASSVINASKVQTTYYCTSFIRATFQSLLDQDHEKVEIIASEDRFTDRTLDRLVIQLHQNPEHFGLVAHFNLGQTMRTFIASVVFAGCDPTGSTSAYATGNHARNG